MNKILVLLCLAFLGFIAWREKATLLEWKNKAVASARKLVSPDPATEGEATSDTNNPPPGPGKLIASTKRPPVAVVLPDPPEGIYYLRARVSVQTGSGVRGYAAGTRVTKTGENLGMAVVTDGSDTFSVEFGQLTRDMSEVVEIQKRAAASGAKAPPRQAVATQVTAPTPAPTANPAPGPPADPGKFERESQRRAMTAQLESMDRQIYAISDQIAAAKGKQAMANARGRSSSATIGVPDLQKKLDQLLADRAKINSKFEALPPQ